MRCITLAQGLRERGARVRFVCRHLPATLRGLVTGDGFELSMLAQRSTEPDELSHSGWLGVSQTEDAQHSLEALRDAHWDWLVVDHYALDARWQQALRSQCTRMLAIDDLADRNHDCDLLLDQNHYRDGASRYAERVAPHTRLLLGPRHALLRPEFAQVRQLVQRQGKLASCLVFFGGMDRDKLTLRALRAIHASGLEMRVDVVAGSGHPALAELSSYCDEKGYQLHVQTRDMARLMAQADLAIGAAGAVSWERCCTGLPSIAFAVARNQEQLLRDAAIDGLLLAPQCEMSRFEDELASQLKALARQPLLLQGLSERAMQLVDGRGLERVLLAMSVHRVVMRRASIADSASLHAWRNHEDVRSWSRNKDPISRENHERWLSSVLSDPARVLLIGEIDGVPAGVVRFDFDEAKAEVSIYLVPGKHRPGTGTAVLAAAEDWLRRHHPAIHAIVAVVLSGNRRSMSLFESAGYSDDDRTYFKRL